MSVNLVMTIRVAGYDTGREEQIKSAILAVLEAEEVDEEFDELSCRDGVMTTETPFPVVVSRSYEWVPKVRDALGAAVTKANGAECEVLFTAEEDDDASE